MTFERPVESPNHVKIIYQANQNNRPEQKLPTLDPENGENRPEGKQEPLPKEFGPNVEHKQRGMVFVGFWVVLVPEDVQREPGIKRWVVLPYLSWPS